LVSEDASFAYDRRELAAHNLGRETAPIGSMKNAASRPPIPPRTGEMAFASAVMIHGLNFWDHLRVGKILADPSNGILDGGLP
jgi:hypothetical protein